MFASVSMDKSELAEFISPAGVEKFTFPRQPLEPVAFTGTPMVNQTVTQPTIIRRAHAVMIRFFRQDR
jgi:hypothetical protein